MNGYLRWVTISRGNIVKSNVVSNGERMIVFCGSVIISKRSTELITR